VDQGDAGPVKFLGVEVADFSLWGEAYPEVATGKMHMAGAVAASIRADFGGATELEYAFDTRDGSWGTAVTLAYASPTVDANILFATASGCSVRGTMVGSTAAA
jgi:hypothetical protein